MGDQPVCRKLRPPPGNREPSYQTGCGVPARQGSGACPPGGGPRPARELPGRKAVRFSLRRSKAAYTGKQKRRAEHIAEGYEKRGVPAEEAKRRAWATVNKEP